MNQSISHVLYFFCQEKPKTSEQVVRLQVLIDNKSLCFVFYRAGFYENAGLRGPVKIETLFFRRFNYEEFMDGVYAGSDCCCSE